jgi:hypothetical protein
MADIQSHSALGTWSMMLFVIASTRMGGSMPIEAQPGNNPRLTALPLEQVATLLRRAGSQRASIEALRADLAAGAPANGDGTLNLIAYGAWLARALANRETAHGG